MDYINILGVSIPMYSVMIITGLILGNIFAYIVIKKRKLVLEDFIVLEAYGLAFGMLGAKLLYLLININSIEWSRLFEKDYFIPLMQGGFVFYGGLFGGVVGIFIAKVIHKINAKEYFADLIFCVPLVHGFGRVGCYFAGCCYGVPYNGYMSVRYHNIPYSLCDINLFPIQLVEAIGLFILALVFYIIINRKQSSMKYVYLYFFSYSILRFIIEIFRYDAQRGKIGIFSTSQWISIAIIIIMSLCLLKIKDKK